MKLPNIGINQSMLPTLAIGAIAGYLLYTMMSKSTPVATSAYGRAANTFFSGETTYYPGAEVYGADAQGYHYLKTNVVPNQTSFAPAQLKHGINAIFRENLETG